jgi:hypothetical protein
MTNKNWTVVELKNGKVLEGIVTNETDTHVSLYKLPFPILKRNIVRRDEHVIGRLTTQMY